MICVGDLLGSGLGLPRCAPCLCPELSRGFPSSARVGARSSGLFRARAGPRLAGPGVPGCLHRRGAPSQRGLLRGLARVNAETPRPL